MLEISKDFNIQDIHNIRENNYETTEDMTLEERIQYYNDKSKSIESLINERRNKKYQKGA